MVGLGNPGRKYATTRHNVGFLVAEAIAGANRLLFQDRTDYRICRGSMGDESIVLLEPLTFMNRSGSAVKKVMDRMNIPPEKVIAIHDDLDLQTGKLRIRKTGSSGGHRGVESVIQSIASRNFARVRIGIGRDPLAATEEYVLSKFSKGETPLIRDAVERAVEAVGVIITEGVDKAMSRFN
ncbi:MAG: aminoacyl-tRNA hydrolase [Nitrospiraceae bacterium]|nr:aminoacyl-tRNA hydrolase [Nitrospiraceae bacterium]